MKYKDPTTNKWVSILGGSSGSGVDVTATVGQTIRVTAVDENGKPTKWEAIDYQPRTHWVEEGMVEVPVKGAWAQTQEGMNAYMCTSPTALEDGKTYVVNWDGVEYTCVAYSVGEITEIHIGNTMMNNGEDNGIPFMGVYVDGIVMFFAVDFTTGHTFTIYEAGEVVHKLDNKFIDAEWMATMGKGRAPVLPKAEYICVNGIIDTFSYEDENAAIDRMEEFISGETYVVTLDGVEYECVAYKMVKANGGFTPFVGIGNQALCIIFPGEDNGLPFFAYCATDRGYNEVYLQDDEGEYTVNLGIDIIGEVPIKLPEKFLPDITGVAGESDWNASEGEAGHIKNRTHWVESGGGTILEETDLTGEDGQFMLECDITLEYDRTYRIVYNGTDYMCTAIDGAAFGEAGVAVLGNTGALLGTGDTGEPFIALGYFSMGLIVLDLAGASSCNIGIYDDSEIVHKLDNKFIDAKWMATSKTNKIPVLEEAEYSVTNTGAGEQDMGRYTNISEISLEIDKKYIIDFDGISYERSCHFLYQQEINCYYLGNMAFANADFDNTGEPFCISIMQELNAYYLFAAEGIHTMGLYETEEVANRLPAKYAPSYTITDVTWDEYGTGTINESYNNFADILWNGGTVYIRRNADTSFAQYLVSCFVWTGAIFVLTFNNESGAIKSAIAMNGVWRPPA